MAHCIDIAALAPHRYQSFHSVFQLMILMLLTTHAHNSLSQNNNKIRQTDWTDRVCLVVFIISRVTQHPCPWRSMTIATGVWEYRCIQPEQVLLA